MPSKIFLYNTLERTKVEFIPLDINGVKVGLYTCGPTVYNFAHIGNLRTYIFEDILKRTLTACGYEVTHVMNITDVGHLTGDSDVGEDKIEGAAQKRGQTVWELAEKYTQAFRQDLQSLNIQQPDIWCKATDHIQQQIALVQELEKGGFTYRLDDGIYFDTSRFPKYADFARLDVKNLSAGNRVEMVMGKRNITDFALWKFSPKLGAKRQMEWDSPWGIGFPGWHIECSAMSMHYLGQRFDIHCGGIDHVPIHHTNEIAQVEALTQQRWVNYWLHGEFLVVQKKGESDVSRMGKSEGNFLTLQVLVNQGYHPLAYRYFLLNAHYRRQLTYTDEAMQSAQNGYKNLLHRISDLKKQPTSNTIPDVFKQKQYHDKFMESACDDLNMPNALAVLWTMLEDKSLIAQQKLALVQEFDKILGLELSSSKQEEIPDKVLELVTLRQKARQEKNWPESDRIRKEIQALGYDILDGKDGGKIKKI